MKDENKDKKENEILTDKELKDVNGGKLPDSVDPKDPLNTLGRDPRNKSKIPGHIILV